MTTTKKSSKKSIRTEDNINTISVEFIKVINEWFTPEQLEEVNRRNALPEMQGNCATHDFYDTNMAMDEAFTKVMGKELDFQNDDHLFLWNEAWDLAKANKFKLDTNEHY